MANTIETAIYRMGLDEKQYVQAAQNKARADEAMVASGAKVVASEEKVAAGAGRTGDAFARLEARYDPLIRNEMRRQAALAQATRIAEEHGVSQDRLTAQIARVNAMYDQQAAAATRAGAAMARSGTMIASGGRAFGGAGLMIQQAGFQVADFAVQVASGQGAMRAFTQQGSQLLGFFGPWGSVIGAGVAIVGAFATGLIASKAAAEDAGKATDTYREAIEKLNKLRGDKSETTHSAQLMEDAKAATAAAIATERLALAELQRQQLEDVGAAGRYQRVQPNTALDLQIQSTLLRIQQLEAEQSKLNSAAANMPRGPMLEYTDATEEASKAVDALIEKQRRLNAHLEQTTKLTAAELDAMVTKSGNIARMAAEAAERARTEAAQQAAEDRANIHEREADLMLEPFRNAAKGIQDALAGAFRNALDGGIDSFKDFANRIVDIMKETAAQVAAMMVFQPVVNWAANKMTMGGGSGGISLGGGGGGGGGFDLGSLFDFGGSSTIPPTARGGQGVPGGTGPGGGGFSWAGAGISAAMNLLPLALGFLSGDKMSGSQIGSGIGGAIGGIGGSFFGPVGSMVGSALGNLLGGLVGGLFGGGFKKPSASGYFDVADNSAFLTDTTNKNGGDGSAARNAVSAYGTTLNALLQQTDLNIMNGRLSGYIQAQSNKDGETNFYGSLAVGQNGGPASQDYYTRVALGGDTRKGEEGLKQVVADLIKETLKQAAEIGALGGSGATATTLTVLRNTKANSIESLGDDLAFARLYDQLAGLSEPTTQYAEALKALNSQFDQAEAKADALGLALAPLAQGRLDAIAKLTTDFNEGIRRSILGFTDPLTLALEDLAKAQEERLKEAKAAGADLVQIERLSALERQRVIEQVTAQQVGDLQRFYESLKFGGLSGASPLGSLEGSRASFLAAAAQASAGDLTAQGRLSELGSQFLGYSRAFNASGAGYQSDLALVTGAIEPFLANGPGSMNATLQNGFQAVATVGTESNSLLSALVAEVTGLRQDNADLRSQLQLILNARAA